MIKVNHWLASAKMNVRDDKYNASTKLTGRGGGETSTEGGETKRDVYILSGRNVQGRKVLLP